MPMIGKRLTKFLFKETQSTASEEINHSIVQVNEMARQSAIAMAEAAQAVTELAAQAHTLKNLIAQMKLG